MDRAATHFEPERVSPQYWRVTFDHPPINTVTADTVGKLAALVDDIECDEDLTVVVFTSRNPDFFLAHYDTEGDPGKTVGMPDGPTGMHPWLDLTARLSRAPVVSIASIRGRARGAGGEFVLATDIRLAGENAILAQFEVGTGVVPGGGPMARLPRLIGRGRALEVLLAADDIDAQRAERYGYVNRVVPDAELHAETEAPRAPDRLVRQAGDLRDQGLRRRDHPARGRGAAARRSKHSSRRPRARAPRRGWLRSPRRAWAATASSNAGWASSSRWPRNRLRRRSDVLAPRPGRRTRGARPRARLAELGAADCCGAPRTGRPRGLLDLLVRELVAHAALRQRVARAIRGRGLVVVGAHAPEFGFEHELDNVRRAVRELAVGYPVVIDNDFRIWRAFDNRYWPAVISSTGRGASATTTSARASTRRPSGRSRSCWGPVRGAVDVEAGGLAEAADRRSLRSPETYLGFARAERRSDPREASSR